MTIGINIRHAAKLRFVAVILCGCTTLFDAGIVNADDLTVSAAASLSNAFGEIAKAYEAQHPETHVVLNFASSDVLLKQIEQGAPADVFASADEATMDRAASGGKIQAETRKDFATNSLVLIVPSGAAVPIRISNLADRTYVRIAIGNPDFVPAGRYTRQALTDAHLWVALRSKFVQAQNVRQALDYVARGEAEAGFVYATDAATQSNKVQIALTVPTSTPVRYPCAVVATSTHQVAAGDFVNFLLSVQSKNVLGKFGFSPVAP